MSKNNLQDGYCSRKVVVECMYKFKTKHDSCIKLNRSSGNNSRQLGQVTDIKQPRKQRIVNERAIYRPPPARTTGILQETAKQNVNPGDVSIFLWLCVESFLRQLLHS